MLASKGSPRPIAIVALALGVVLLLTDGCDGGDGGGKGGEGGSGKPGRTPATVTRVVDGDTVEVALPGGIKDVRYIGIDTPESVAPDQPVECFGERASALNRRLVEGKRVVLVFDQERRDQYGRLLAYVYVGDLFVNAKLVRDGFARTLAISPNTEHATLFDRLEQQAGNAGRGLWGSCEP